MEPSQIEIIIESWLNLGLKEYCSIETLNNITPREISAQCIKNNWFVKPNRVMLILRILGFKMFYNNLFAEDPNFKNRMIKTVRMFGTTEQINHYLKGCETNEN